MANEVNSVIKSLGDFTNSIDVKISDEIKLVTKRKDLKSGIYKNCTNLALAYCTLNTYQQKQSIIYKALKKVFKPSNYRLENDKENTEDIISEALYLLRKSAIQITALKGFSKAAPVTEVSIFPLILLKTWLTLKSR